MVRTSFKTIFFIFKQLGAELLQRSRGNKYLIIGHFSPSSSLSLSSIFLFAYIHTHIKKLGKEKKKTSYLRTIFSCLNNTRARDFGVLNWTITFDDMNDKIELFLWRIVTLRRDDVTRRGRCEFPNRKARCLNWISFSRLLFYGRGACCLRC